MGAEAGARRPLRLAAPERVLVALLLGVSGLLDLPAAVGLGGLSGVGLLTIGQLGVVALAVLACRQFPWRLVTALAPYAVFLLWASLSTVFNPPSVAGMQNWVVYVLFGLVVLFAGTVAARHPEAMEGAVDDGVRWIDRIALSLSVLALVFHGLPDEAVPRVVAARSLALLGLIPLAWHLAQWHEGRSRSGVLATLWLLAIALTLSRTAIAVSLIFMGVVLVLQQRWNPRALLLKAPAMAVATLVTAVVLLQATPIADRMFTGDTSIRVGGVAVNASGRLAVWGVVVESGRNAPVIGQGLGSSQHAAATFDGIGHPHNDYLRLWHDLGLVGLALALAALATMLRQVFDKWRAAARGGAGGAAIHLAALLALAGALLAYVTDNALIYPYVMTPLGILVGTSLGVRAPNDLARGPRG